MNAVIGKSAKPSNRLRAAAKRCLGLVAACALIGFGAVPVRADPPTINSMGVDIAAYVPVFATALGLVIVACLAVYFGLAVINRGLTWFSRTSARR